MKLETIIAAVCRMPRDLRSSSDKSMVVLFQESGCAGKLDSIGAHRLAAHLRENPGLVADWLLDSADRRTGSGPYLEEPDDEGAPWLVGQYPAGTHAEYHDGATACAAFIMQRLQELADCAPGSG